MATNIEVIIGTYEEFLLGYKVEISPKNDDSYTLNQSFAVHAHTASIRSVDARGRYLASAGADDRIYIYDMRSRQEIQMLTPHEGIINAVQFTPDHTHLFSASADGSFAATRTGSWVTEGFWKAPHGGKPITYISIHPSGKLALTLGADLTLKTWNLIKGRQIFTTNLKSKSSLGRIIDFVQWGPTGQFFTLTGAKTIELWDIDTAGVVKEFSCDARPTCVCWLDDETQLVGLNDGKLLMMSIHDDEPTIFQMYEGSRVKGLAYRDGFLASISSGGDVTIWQVDVDKRSIDEVCTTNIGCRPICLTLLDLSAFAKDYVLKMEGAEEAEADEVSDGEEQPPSKKRPSAPASSGRVVIEVDNDNEEETAKSKNKKMGKKKKAGQSGVANGAGASKGNNKQSKNAKLNESVSKVTPGKRKSVSTFVEEDAADEEPTQATKVTSAGKATPKKPTIQPSNKKARKSIGGFKESDIASPQAIKKFKKSRRSIA